MTIKHLVISGGGPTGIGIIGILQHLEQNNFWNINNIQSIYATSIGGIIGAMLCCKFDWDTLNTYIIQRPWHESIPIQAEQLLNAYMNKGIFDMKCFHIFFKPLFDAKNISLDITMYDFYKYSNIELHLFSLELNNFETCDISYKTYPDLSLLTAIHMTCAIPVLFSPVCLNNKCYLDGGIVNNYPLENCLQEYSNVDEVLSFKNIYCNDLGLDEITNITEQSNLLEFITFFLKTLINNLNTQKVQHVIIPNQIEYKTNYMSIDFIKMTLESEIYRKELLNSGIQAAKDFLQKKMHQTK
jgi:predicted acylesterase/phospholipase RssA